MADSQVHLAAYRPAQACLTLDDTAAPEFTIPCGLPPAPPLPPEPPGSPTSPRSLNFRVVDCGEAVDLCDSVPIELTAEVIVRYQEVVGGECVSVEEVYAVECGQEVEFELVAPPCPPAPPVSSPPPASDPPGGPTVFTGEEFELIFVCHPV